MVALVGAPMSVEDELYLEFRRDAEGSWIEGTKGDRPTDVEIEAAANRQGLVIVGKIDISYDKMQSVWRFSADAVVE